MNLAVDRGGRPLGVRGTYDALDDYARTYGELPLRLLLHAAVPQSFRADLLNLLKVNFVPEAGGDLSVDADVLLSPLVEATAAGYFRFDPEVRRQSLDLLDAVYRSDGSRRSIRVARFLIAWLDQLEQAGASGIDPLFAEYAVIQRWVALALIDPPAVVAALARSLSDALDEDEGAVRARLGGIAAALSIPLAGHQPLISYAQGIDALRTGNIDEARQLLEPLGESEIRIGDVTLRPAADLLDAYLPQQLEIHALAPKSEEEKAADPSRSPRPPSSIGSPRLYFISYSPVDGEEIALRLGDQLAAGPPIIPIWLAARNLQPGRPGFDWDEQIIEALRDCEGLLYVMTQDSVSPASECRKEWMRALKYRKPIIPLLFEDAAELPYHLEPREPIKFTKSFEAGLARLREHMRWRGTAEGVLYTLRERLKDARRDLARAAAAERSRIQEEIAELERRIGEQQQQAIEEAQQRCTEELIRAAFELERQSAKPLSGEVHTRFINRLPMIPPVYFQDRHVETGLIGAFLKDESLRLMTVLGRSGVGKTAMVCRLLRSLEGGKLPDDGSALAVDGIVYLAARAGHPVNFPNLFADLCKLLPETTTKLLDQLRRDAKQSTAAQMQTLLAAFPSGRTIVLLDNFDDVIDAETQAIKKLNLDAALRAALEAPPHGVKFLLTTRVAPQALLRTQPALQQTLVLEEGLASPYAEEVLKAMDANGTLGLHDPEAPLDAAREATRGYPRALEAIVGILRTDRGTTLPEVLVELQQLHPKAGAIVQVLVGEAFNRLDPTAQQVMQALAIYGAPVPAGAVDYLLQPYRVGIDSARVLGRLVGMQFVRSQAGRYYLHQVDRDYALSRVPQGEPEDRAEPSPFTRYALHHRAAEYLKETRKPRE